VSRTYKMGDGPGARALAGDGYAFVTDAPTTPADFDHQAHLNNAAVVRMLNDLRIAFVRQCLGSRWTDYLQRESVVVVVRELHVLYESEGLPDERFVGSVRIGRRSGKAGIIEQRIVEAATARAVARSWVVQLIARDGRAVDFPEWYWPLIAEIQGRPVPEVAAAERAPWGPP